MPVLIPVIVLVSLGVGTLVTIALASADRDVPDHPPDLPSAPLGKTRWRLVNVILSQLQAAAVSAGVPLGLLVGWICKESGGKIAETTKYGEVGLFQLMPSEYKKLGLDPALLSSDVVYSINGGLALIATYMGDVDRLGVAQRGTEYFWRLVKLCHSMGTGAVKVIVAMAKDAGEARTWKRLEDYAIEHDAEILHAVKHSPKKWFPFVDEVASIGAPFGFGSQDTIVGGEVFADIVDPLDALPAA